MHIKSRPRPCFQTSALHTCSIQCDLKHRIMPRFHTLLSAVILCTAVLSRDRFAAAFNATFDPCETSDQCEPTLSCMYEENNKNYECSETTTYDDCKCRNLFLLSFCDSTRYRCIVKYDACGKSLTDPSLNGVCVSCNLLTDPTSDFVPVDDGPVCDFSPAPVPTPSPSPQPARRSFDWCSADAPCDAGFSCYSYIDSSSCNSDSLACYCLANRPARIVCQTPQQCPHPRESCATYAAIGETLCASCSIIKTDPDYIPLPNDTSCDKVVPLPTPTYLPPSNGLAFEDCTTSSQCYAGYTCLGPKLTPCSEKEDIICSCFKKSNGPQDCNDTSDCPAGELCVKQLRFSMKACTSISFYRRQRKGLYRVLGRFPERGALVKGDPCRADHECTDDLYCTHRSNDQKLGGCLGRRACTCISPTFTQCVSRKDCRDRETCVFVPDSLREPFCFSAKSAKLSPYFRDLRNASAKPTPTILPTNGWTFDGCSNDGDCMQDVSRKCRHILFGAPCRGKEMCQCVLSGSNTCTRSEDCSSGEACVVVADSVSNAIPECISREVLQLDYYKDVYDENAGNQIQPISSPSPSASASTSQSPSASTSSSPTVSPTVSPTPTASQDPSPDDLVSGSVSPESESEVCVDARALAHMHPSELVFSRPRRASVLCDESGSCATPGHLVTWRDKPMAMRTYCKLHARCTRAVKYVNSPRMKRFLRVQSQTQGLQYTPFAARFESHIEEHLLRALLRLGW